MIRFLLLALLFSSLAILATSCESFETADSGVSDGQRVTRVLPPTVPVPPQEPVVRVRIARAAAQVDITAPSAVRITCYAPGAAYATPQPLQYACPLRISQQGGRFVIQGLATAARPATGAVAVNWPALLIEPLTAYRQVPAIRIGNVDYPQRIVLYPSMAAPGGNPGGNSGGGGGGGG